jgi:hypothetical protein
MRPGNDVDGIDLELRQTIRHRLDIPDSDWSLESRDTEALRSERDPSRLSLTQLISPHSPDATGLH